MTIYKYSLVVFQFAHITGNFDLDVVILEKGSQIPPDIKVFHSKVIGQLSAMLI